MKMQLVMSVWPIMQYEEKTIVGIGSQRNQWRMKVAFKR